jgi:Domain of unknown function (DUF5666)
MRAIYVVLAAAFAASTACGGDNKASGPTQPSGITTAAPASAIAGASIAGTVVGVTGATAAPFRTLGTGMTVSVTGSNLSSAVDDNGRFQLQGVPAGHVELHFAGRGADARLVLDNVAEHEAIQIVVRVNGAVAEVEDNHRQTPDNHVEIEGIVAEVNASAGTLRVRDTVVSVPAGTTIRHSTTTFRLADVRVGDRVEIHGTMNGGTIVAADIEIENEHAPEPGEDHGNPGPNPGPGTGGDDDGHGDDHGEAEVSGAVAGKGGTCPSIHFTIGSTAVQTSGSTEFRDVTCSALANGDRVEVKGSRATSATTINARRVERKK